MLLIYILIALIDDMYFDEDIQEYVTVSTNWMTGEINKEPIKKHYYEIMKPYFDKNKPTD